MTWTIALYWLCEKVVFLQVLSASMAIQYFFQMASLAESSARPAAALPIRPKAANATRAKRRFIEVLLCLRESQRCVQPKSKRPPDLFRSARAETNRAREHPRALSLA